MKQIGLEEIEELLVDSLMHEADGNWVRIVVNYELEVYAEDAHESKIGFYIVRKRKGEYEDEDIGFTETTKKCFRRLNQRSLEINGKRWGTCDLVIEHSGKYRIEYSYDPPKRINGIFDEQSCHRFTNYTETHLKELDSIQLKR